MVSKLKAQFLITSLPPELFSRFCTFLPPADLFALSQVCRKFRKYLCAPNSFSTQQIWKESRLRFMPKEDMPPPEGMSEENYVALLMTELGCQFCKCKGCKIYWEFGVRCCYECFSKKIVSIPTWLDNYYCNVYPREFLDVMPHTYSYCRIFYWKEQIEIAYSQYTGLSNESESLQSWLGGKKYMLDSIMKYVKQRKLKVEKIYSPSIIYLPTPPRLPFRSFTSPPSYSVFSILERNLDQIYEQESMNIIRKSDEPKRKDFIERKKNKREFYSKHNEFHMKGRSIKNKFAHKYG